MFNLPIFNPGGIVAVSKGKEDIGKIPVLANDGKLDPSVIPGGAGGQGTPGKSAYEIAVDHGFVGTEVEWLASVKGADGEGAQINYNTKEQFTGRYWIDGKKIYQKTIDFGGLPNNATKKIAHEIDNMALGINHEIIAHDSAGVFLCLPYTHYANISYQVCVHFDITNVVAMTAIDYAIYNYNVYVTLYYTCTNR